MPKKSAKSKSAASKKSTSGRRSSTKTRGTHSAGEAPPEQNAEWAEHSGANAREDRNP